MIIGILLIVAIVMVVLETISILGSANMYGIRISPLEWPILIIDITKINHNKGLNSYGFAKITLFVLIRMWMTAENADKDAVLSMDEAMYGGVVSKLVRKGRVSNKW